MKTKLFGLSVFLGVFFIAMSSLCFSGEIKLMFPEFETEERKAKKGTYIASPRKGREGKQVYSEKGLSEFVKEFEQKRYRVDQIELWIDGREESGGVTRLYISLEESGGYKVILKPKTDGE